MKRQSLRVLSATALVALFCGTFAVPSSLANGTLGSWEIDGNLADDSGSGEPIDWAATPPPVVTNIPDKSGSNSDDIFSGGSKQLDPAGWSCTAQKPPGKIDIVSGQMAVRRFPATGDQFAYLNYFRKDINGDAHMDFEVNKSSVPLNTSCGKVPQRSQGDMLVAFDTTNGGATIDVRIFRWDGTATSGTFTDITGTSNADGAVNIPPSKTIPGHKNGDFGEAAVNLTRTIGTLSCSAASGVWMKTRSSSSISSELKDFTQPVPVKRSDCPLSSLAKAVRNVTTGQAFTTTGPTSTTGSPGQTLEYRLTYTNTGNAVATNVVVTDTIQPKQAFDSCSDGCTVTNGVVRWELGTVAPGTTTRTFRVTLTGPFPAGTTTVKNTGSFTNTEEGSKSSNEVSTAVTANPISAVVKSARNVTTNGAFGIAIDAKPGDTIEYRLVYDNTGNADATNVVVSDPIPGKSAFVSCTLSCTQTGSPVSSVSWNLGTQAPANQPVEMLFRVTIDSTGWTQGQAVPVKNVATVCTTSEGCKNSPGVIVTVKTPNVSMAKAVRNVTTGQAFTASGPTSTTALPGQVLEYRLTVTNNGVAAATNVVVTDTLEAHQTWLSCAPACTSSGSPLVLRWTVASLAPGASVPLTFQVRLDTTFPAGTTPVKNTGVVSSDQEPAKSSNETTTTITAAPISGLAKAARNVTTSGAFGTALDASPGDTIEYRLTYSNTGDAAASNVVISDPVPGQTTFVSCDPTCAQTATPVSSVSWTYASVAPGTTITVTFRVAIDQTGFTPGRTTAISNVAQVCTTEEGCKNSPPVTVNVKTPLSSIAKAVRNVTADQAFTTSGPTATTASPGNVLEYRLTYTNSGPGIAHDVVLSDPIPTRTSLVSCSTGCDSTTLPGTVRWTFASVASGAGQVVTFQVRLDSVFPSGTTVITNVGAATTAEEPGTTSSNPTTVTATAAPDLSLVKSADKTETVVFPEVITYTLTYSNSGNADAEGTVITETVPAGTTYQGCTPTCQHSNGTVTWDLGTVPAGGFGAVTMSVSVALDVACEISNVATIASPSQGSGAPISSNRVRLIAQPPANPALAKASGSALGASVKADLPLVGVVNEQRAQTSSAQSGVGTNGNEAYLDTTPVPNPLLVPPVTGALLQAQVMRTSSTSTVSASPAQARDLGTAETLGVSAAGGLVTADVVLAKAEATANGGSSSFSPVGSTFKNLRVQGAALNDVAPNTRIDVGDVAGLGLDVTVVLREELGSTSGPPATTLYGGTYAADLTVNMIRIHVGDGNLVAGGKQPIDIIVSQAKAHADFPQVRICDAAPTRAVSGRALIASESTDPSIAPLTVGFLEIPASGGTRQFGLDAASLPDNGSVLTSSTAESFSTGALGATSTTARSFAAAEGVCIRLVSTTGCNISATLVRSVASSSAAATSRSSAPGSGSDVTRLVDLRVAGVAPGVPDVSFPFTPAANTVIGIPGVATIILNEQVCDNGGTLALGCANGSVTGHTGLTVRAIHVILLDQAAGGNPGAEIVVAEAHSDATWK